jgi:ABC-2 type transport system permease protein
MSESFGLFFSYPGKVIKRYLSRERFTRVFTISIFLLIIALVGVSLYTITVGGLRFISKNTEFQNGLQFYIVQLFGILIFTLAFGNSILVMATGFAKRNYQWIATTPSFAILAFIQLFQLLASSVWIFLAIITPVLLAIGNFTGISWLGFVLSFVLTVALIIVASVSGTFAYLLTLYLLQAISNILKRNIVTQSRAILILIVFFIITAIGLWRIAVPQDFIQFFNGNSATQIATIRDQLIYLPTFGVSHILYNILFENTSFGVGYVVILSTLSIIVIITLYALLRIQYLSIWQLLQEGNYVADKNISSRNYAPYNFPSASIVKTIIDKELLLIWRDKKNLLWLLIVITLWGAQTAVSWRVTANVAVYGAVETIPNFVYPLILAIGLYFISALALRFVFPTFSAERKVAWILGVSPISLWNIAVGKLLIYAGLFTLLGSPLLIANFALLNFAFFPAIIYWIVFSLSIILIVLLAIFLSIRYPNRFSSDPETLSTTLPGLAFTSFALGGSLIISNIMYLALTKIDLAVLLMLLISLLSLLLTSLIYRATEKFEYSGEIIA